MMTKLSVNVNKVATLRNSRGGHLPSVTDAVLVCVTAGAPGITVHPRADARHITFADVRAVSAELRTDHPGIEFNIEGDPRPDLLALVHEVRPDQCTLVPVREGEVTSQAGWPSSTPVSQLQTIIRDLQRAGVRVSVFIDPDLDAVRWAASLAADRIELYTEPYARAYAAGGDVRKKSFDDYAAAARLAHSLRPRHQRRSRSRPRQPDALPHAPLPRRGLDRARPHQPCAVRGARSGGEGLSGGSGELAAALLTPGLAVTKPFTAERAEIAEHTL